MRLDRALWDWRITIEDLIDISELGGGGGHIIQDEGSDLPQQARLNFIGAGVTATNNSGTGATDVTITGTSSGTGTVTSITATTPIVVTPDPIVTTGTVSHATSGVSAGTYGDSSHVAQITVNATGHVTAAAEVGFSVGTNVIEITTPGTGTVPIPDGVSAMWVTTIGAGGGGGTSAATAGGGGGGAGEQISGLLVAVPDGGTVAYTLPAGGAADADGGATIFGDFIALGGRRRSTDRRQAALVAVSAAARAGLDANPGTGGRWALPRRASGSAARAVAAAAACGNIGRRSRGRVPAGVLRAVTGECSGEQPGGGGGGGSTIYGHGWGGWDWWLARHGGGGDGLRCRRWWGRGQYASRRRGGQGYLLLSWIGTP